MTNLLMPYGSARFAEQVSKVGNGAPPPVPAPIPSPPKTPSGEADPGEFALRSGEASWRRGSKGKNVRINFFEPYGQSGQAPLVAKVSQVPPPIPSPPKTGVSKVKRLNASKR